jgi:nucleoside-diphosphate-sugar epimerase
LRKASGFNIFNVGTQTSTTIQELAEKILKIAGISVPIIHGDGREGDIRDSMSNISKIKSLLHWSPKTTLEQGLKLTFDWYCASGGYSAND